MPSDDSVDPARLESQTFDVVRRGFDPASVRAQLQEAAREIRRLRLERDELTGRLAEYDGVGSDELEAHRVAEALGVEATQVLEAAHSAATERAERAEREAEAVREEARAAAEATRTEGVAERDELIESARREAETIAEDGRTRGREMVTEAQAVRERMLRDLARKRQAGRSQVEQLRAGRDRLLESLTTAQQVLDTAIEDLVNSVPEARAAAERAGLRIEAESTPTAEELEDEIESAHLVGHPLVEDLPSTAVLDSDPFPTGEMEALSHLDALDDGSDAATADDLGERDEADEPTEVADTAERDVVDEVDEVADTEDADDIDDVTAASTELYDVEAEEAAAVSDADAGDELFARLRSSQAEGATDESPEDEAEDEPETAADEAPEDQTEEPAPAEPEEPEAREPESDEPEADEPEAAEPEAEEPEAPTPREVAAEAAAKAMKKILVEEQGTLLDGIRRSGAEAVRVVVDDAATHDASYDKAATPALRQMVATLGGPKRLALGPALEQIHAIALEPVRQRLAEVAERVDDADELSDTVRALYRESRSRRLPEAAAAAAVAVDGLFVLHRSKKGSVRWVVQEGGPCGPDCADNALAGDVDAGDEFPTGDRHPPAHPACTCRLEAAPG